MTPTIPIPTHRQILSMAIPIILANSASPLLALTDIAIIGHFGGVADLSAIALGTLLFSFIFWGFGFLRMSTSGFVAQARGRDDDLDQVATIARGLLLAFAIGIALIALQQPIISIAMRIFGADPETKTIAREFFSIRIWSAPATLALYVLTGFFIGSGAGRALLIAQLVLNGANILLDIFFAGVLQMGARGVAFGTALAEWLTLFIAGAMVWRQLRVKIIAVRAQLRAALFNSQKLRALLAANGDIMLRTLSLLAGFAIFTDQGARFGAATLAANHLLLQLVSFSAFFLDGFAYVAEALVGRAHGANDRLAFRAVVRRSSHLAAATALLLALVLWFAGNFFIDRLTTLEAVRDLAREFLPFCAAYVLLSFAAFQFDGIFIGTTQSRPLRNAAVVSTALFALMAFPLAQQFGNHGLWLAFIGFVVVRALALGAYYPRVFKF